MSWVCFFLLAFVAGFVDTATFLGARGVFSAHVTGNFVLFAVAITRGVREIDYLKLFLFVPFLVSLFTVARLSRVKSLEKYFEPLMLGLAALLLLIPALYFFGVTTLQDELWDWPNFFIMLTVLAMGIQNALYKILTPKEPMTTVMTGNVITAVLEMAGFRGETGERAAHRAKAVSTLRLITGFALGCATGALLVSRFSLVALAVPALILGAMAFYRGVFLRN